MGRDWLKCEVTDQGLALIELNRAPVNALSAEFLLDFADLLGGLAADASVRAVVLTSAFKAFSAGLDLAEAQAFDLKDEQEIVRGLNVGFLAQFAFPKPVIAAVNGPAIAGGLFFVLASDYRISTPGAQFGLAEVRVGADFPVGPLEIARQALSTADARRLMLGGLPIGSEAALQAGIVDEIVPHDDLRDRAMRKALEYAVLPPKTFASVKRQLRGATIDRIELAMENGANAPANGWFTEESKTAMQAMLDSRRRAR